MAFVSGLPVGQVLASPCLQNVSRPRPWMRQTRSRKPVCAVLPPSDPVVDPNHLAVHAHHLMSSLHIATKGDIGPFANIDLESTGLAAAISGGAIVAGFIVFVLVRF